MKRKILAALLIVTCAAMSLPAAASAGEPAKPNTSSVTLKDAIARAAVAEVKADASRLQQAQGQPQTTPSGGGLSSGAKIGIGAAIVAAAIATGIAIAQGPDPRRWP
jgi:hypothetical protein